MALSAISAGVTSGVASAAGKFTSLSALNGETLTAGVLRAGVSNAIGQGVGIATGLQKRFDWAGLATAGVVGGVTALANQLPWNKVPGLARLPDKLGEAARGGLVGAAAAVAGAASRSLLTGTDFGDNINAVLPDVIGATIGSSIGVKLADGANKPLVVAGSFQGSSLIAGGSGADTLGGTPSATDAGVPASANERAKRVSLWQRAKNFFSPVFGPISAAIKDRSVSPILRGLGITAPGSTPAPAFNLAASANTVEELVVTGLRRARDLFTQSRIIQTLNSYRSAGRASVTSGGAVVNIGYPALELLRAQPYRPSSVVSRPDGLYAWRDVGNATRLVPLELAGPYDLRAARAAEAALRKQQAGEDLYNIGMTLFAARAAGAGSVSLRSGAPRLSSSLGRPYSPTTSLSVNLRTLEGGSGAFRVGLDQQGMGLAKRGGAAERTSYANLVDSPFVGPGKAFTTSQKAKILQQNLEANGGVLRSDLNGENLVLPSKSVRGVTPPTNEAQIDHIFARVPNNPRAPPGSNSFENAQVLSRAQNRAKSNN